MTDSAPREGAPGLIWRNAGEPAHKYKEESYEGPCATCATEIRSGVHTKRVAGSNFSNHTEFFKWGEYVCPACAWLYGAGRGMPGSFIAFAEEYLRPVVSPDAPKYDPPHRPTWMDALKTASGSAPGAPMTGVLTSDVKARVWPRIELAICSAPGLYVHAPDYDVSEWRALDLSYLLEVADVASEALCALLTLDAGKRHLMASLYANRPLVAAYGEEVIGWEEVLGEARDSPEFIPAVMVAHATEAWVKAKKREKEDRVRATAGKTAGGREKGGGVNQDNPRLF